jgi:hypothetical protein
MRIVLTPGEGIVAVFLKMATHLWFLKHHAFLDQNSKHLHFKKDLVV